MERNIPRRSKECAIHQLQPSAIERTGFIIPRGDLSDDSDVELEAEVEEEEEGGEDDEDSPTNDVMNEIESSDETEPEAHSYRWRRRSNGIFPTKYTCGSSESTTERPESPYLRFKEYFPDDLFEFIADQTNMYSVEKSGASINTNAFEIEQLFAIWIYMGIFSAPSYRDYWSPLTRWPCIADIMAVNRYEKLMQFFHSCENQNQLSPGDPGYDPLFKVRKLFDAVREKCRAEIQTEFQCIDEQIIPFKGRHVNKQYLPAKPHPWGFKMVTRGSSSGIVYDFVLYSGKYTELIEPVPHMSTTANCVRTLCKSIPHDVKNMKLFMDNFYITFDLIFHLKKEFCILTTGTVRKNRLHGCPLATEKEMKVTGRGSHDQVVDANSNLTVVRWLDNKAVTLASMYLQAEPFSTVKRWNGKEKKTVEVSRPHIVAVYNTNMGGIDLSDMLLTIYQNHRKSRKWYFRIIYYLVWIASSNCWLTYRNDLTDEEDRAGKRLSFKDFLLQTADGLSKVGKACRARPGRPSLAVNQPTPKRKRLADENVPVEILRKDHVDHLPEHSNRGRCKHCTSGFTRWKCRKCSVHLCLNANNNCFSDFHEDS